MSSSNPFAGLFQDNSEETPANNAEIPKKKSFSNILEDIFGFTLNKNIGEQNDLLFLSEIADHFHTRELDLPILGHALFDRLFMCNSDNGDLKKGQELTNAHAFESRIVVYLYNCYRNIYDTNTLKDNDLEAVKSMIKQNLATAFKQPEIFEGQDLYSQLVEILKEDLPYTQQFFQDICKALLEDSDKDPNPATLEDLINNIIILLKQKAAKTSLAVIDYTMFRVINIVLTDGSIGSIFMDKCQPVKPDIGIDYANTLLGALLNISVIPKTPNAPYEYFSTPTDVTQINVMQQSLQVHIDKVGEHIHAIFLKLLRGSPASKEKILKWIGGCLKANADRGKLWNSHAPAELNPASYNTVSDGFMLNLTNVLLRLSQPFCTKEKVLKVDPTYCAVPNEEIGKKGIHLPDMASETCLIPLSESEGNEEQHTDEKRPTAESYSFLTECFYLTHRAIDLGFRVAIERTTHLNQELARLERTHSDTVGQANNGDLESMLAQQMKQAMIKYLCHKTQILESNLVKMFYDLASVTAHWLCQVAVHHPTNDCTTYAPLEDIPIKFPLPNRIPSTLACIPEFIVENIVHFLISQVRFNESSVEEAGYEKLSSILTFIMVFMGSKERMKNPHIRARLAEALEALTPYHRDETSPMNRMNIGDFQRKMLFTEHEHRSQIVINLLEVFVGIEMTGQSVEFEQKFNYRRPMYAVIDYLWDKPAYQNAFKELAEEAERNMEAVNPPIFLRFVNLLLNDAVFLLDEALANMAKLRDIQTARDNGEWNNLPPMERVQNHQYYNQIGMIARFDNILGRETIKTLVRLTSKITIVFTHPTMVERVAAMLNYFLLNLVGPNKKNFKVKSQEEYSFNPAATVLDICQIYVNLKSSEAFCLAVSQDGRSYRSNLFKLAEDVLARIGGGLLICELKEVAEKVAKKAVEHQANEEVVAEAPEHFFDPIMSTLMMDPVILPSSRQTVDRTTIARHLLSDQTDPFNRAPLTMDQVIPNTELAEEIRNWLEERRK